jgi:hypothetical protein
MSIFYVFSTDIAVIHLQKNKVEICHFKLQHLPHSFTHNAPPIDGIIQIILDKTSLNNWNIKILLNINQQRTLYI